MAGTGETYVRNDGKFAFRTQSSNGQIVATDGSQGYSNKTEAQSTAGKLNNGDYNGPITDA